MGKLLLLLAGLFVVVAVLRATASLRRKPSRPETPPKPDATSSGAELQTLLPCPQCGVHMSASELAAHAASHTH